MVLVHGGMAQNVGPILEMVTEKYLLRSEAEWDARQEALGILDEVLVSLKTADIASIGAATTRNFQGPIQTIVPWASTFYTETLINEAKLRFGDSFWGFWMMGGMSGGGMGFFFAPEKKAAAQDALLEIMTTTRQRLRYALPFAMDPVVYDFAINDLGTNARVLTGDSALLPRGYYAQIVPDLLRRDLRTHAAHSRRAELDSFGEACRTQSDYSGMVGQLFDRLLERDALSGKRQSGLAQMLAENGFDPITHEHIRQDLKAGRIGLAQNRLPVEAVIADVEPGDVFDVAAGVLDEMVERGREALSQGRAAVVTLAAGVGSRWTQGAGAVKALSPFAKLGGRHRTFIEAHLAKSRKTSRLFGTPLPHIITTSYLTHDPLADYLSAESNYGYTGPLLLSPGRSIGLRLVPTVRDLRFAWEEMSHERLDVQAQKVRESLRTALIGWAERTGEASDYTDNIPEQCMHPVGHWYELPNMLRNGTLARLLETRPNLEYLLLHNVDTLGADMDPGVLGSHIALGGALSFEVIPKRLEDRGGGLARVGGRPRMVEGLAMPREEAEFGLSYYNSMSTWVTIDRLLDAFGLTRNTLSDEDTVLSAIRDVAGRMPTYVTLKDVKRRWGHAQEDIVPVAQFEKLWSDMTSLAELDCRFLAVPRRRGQQLKEQAQLDGWLRDGSAAYVETLCDW